MALACIEAWKNKITTYTITVYNFSIWFNETKRIVMEITLLHFQLLQNQVTNTIVNLMYNHCVLYRKWSQSAYMDVKLKNMKYESILLSTNSFEDEG